MAAKKPPKVGEVRLGAKGTKYNKWNGKRWVPVSSARTGAGSGQKASTVSKAIPKKPSGAAAKGGSKQAAREAQKRSYPMPSSISRPRPNTPAERGYRAIKNAIGGAGTKSSKETYLSYYGTRSGGKRIK